MPGRLLTRGEEAGALSQADEAAEDLAVASSALQDLRLGWEATHLGDFAPQGVFAGGGEGPGHAVAVGEQAVPEVAWVGMVSALIAVGHVHPAPCVRLPAKLLRLFFDLACPELPEVHEGVRGVVHRNGEGVRDDRQVQLRALRP